ncbi:unnamed protein product [Alopecurus aequalis]
MRPFPPRTKPHTALVAVVSARICLPLPPPVGLAPPPQLLSTLVSSPSFLVFPLSLSPFLPCSPTQPNRTTRRAPYLVAPSLPRFMELFFELLLTAAATLFVACLLAKLFAANNDPRHHGPAVGPAAVIAEEKVEEEERIIEVDEVKAKGARADAAALSEGWVEVDKVPAAAEGKAAWVAVEERVPATLAPELFLGTVLEERNEEGEVGKKQRDLTPEVEVTAAEAKPRDFGADETTAPREVIDVEQEKERVHQHDLAAEVAPREEVLDAELQKQQVQATEAVVVEQPHLVAQAAPAEVIDAGLEEEEEEAQADELIPPAESASETVPDEVPDVVLEKKAEEPVTEVMNQHELAAEVAPREIPDVVAREEELKEQSVGEAVHQHEEVQSKEETQCEVDQQEKLVPEEELVVRKADDLNVSQEDSSNDKVVVQLPEKEAALLGMLEGEAGANMEFEEWEGIERSEVEKRFGAAAAFAASDAGAAALSKLDSDVQLQLQGLLKVAIDGPCYDSTQPLTLRPSSRAKWVSWQKLGNMHPEMAMEKYMDLLSEFIPRWMGDKTSNTKKHEGDVDSEGDTLTMTARTSDAQTNQGNEGSTSIDEGPLTSPPNPDKEL